MNKNFLVVSFMTAALLAGCSSNYQVKQEYPKSPNLGRYKVVKVGWIDYPAGLWRAYGFRSQGEWAGIIANLNRKSLHEYIADSLGSRKVSGPFAPSAGIPAGGELYIKFGFRGINRQYNLAAGNADYMTVTVEFYDIRSRRKIYGATVTVNSYRAFPHNWKATHFEGRLDNEVYNLAQFIAGKF